MTVSLVALPIGLYAAPVLAAPPTVVDNNGWQEDCDHTGRLGWQQDRGQWRMGDCDFDHGHWQWMGDRDHGQWRWHHDRDYAPPPPMRPFGSS